MAAAWPLAGCQSAGPASGERRPRPTARGEGKPIRAVRCVYDQRPWLNLDAAGDRDPEGVHFRVFLDPGTDQGMLRNGHLRIEMYRIDRKTPGTIDRVLVGAWDYPTSAFQTVKSNILGMGYHVRVRWADKAIAGNEVELITHYRDPDGRTIRSGTKRLRVPAYRT